jgi:uncharacterized protein
MLVGMASYLEKGVSYRFAYRLKCDHGWRTLSCRLHGKIRDRSVRWDYRLTPQGMWSWNGTEVMEPGPWLDIDLGFTPATNLTQLRRMNLAVGEAADMPVAWLDPENGSLTFLPQRYRRMSASTYAYESPTVG